MAQEGPSSSQLPPKGTIKVHRDIAGGGPAVFGAHFHRQRIGAATNRHELGRRGGGAPAKPRG